MSRYRIERRSLRKGRGDGAGGEPGERRGDIYGIIGMSGAENPRAAV
ncbi:MAG: hypothetical protein ACLVJ8_14655 [Ruthenibacterium lactatiformans]